MTREGQPLSELERVRTRIERDLREEERAIKLGNVLFRVDRLLRSYAPQLSQQTEVTEGLFTTEQIYVESGETRVDLHVAGHYELDPTHNSVHLREGTVFSQKSRKGRLQKPHKVTVMTGFFSEEFPSLYELNEGIKAIETMEFYYERDAKRKGES